MCYIDTEVFLCIKLSILILIITGCMEAKDKEFNSIVVEDFPPAIELKGYQILEDEPVILTSGIVDSLLFFESFEDTVFHVFDRNEKAIAKFGLKGRGPGEFSFPPKLSQLWKEDGEVHLLAIDNPKKQLVEINISASIEQNEIVINKSFKIPSDLLGLRDVFKVSDNEYAGVYDDRNYKKLDGRRGVFLYHLSEDSIDIFPLLNLKLASSNDVVNEINLNTRIVEKAPGQAKLAMAYRYLPIVEVFDLKQKKMTSRYLLESDPPDTTFSIEDFKEGNLIRYFENIYVTNDKIYLLKVGQPEKVNKSEQTILVMDWQGNPLSSYLIPKEYDLSQIIVDESQRILYGVNYSSYEMYKFKF